MKKSVVFVLTLSLHTFLFVFTTSSSSSYSVKSNATVKRFICSDEIARKRARTVDRGSSTSSCGTVYDSTITENLSYDEDSNYYFMNRFGCLNKKAAYIRLMKSVLSMELTSSSPAPPEFLAEFKKLYSQDRREQISETLNLQIILKMDQFNVRNPFIYYAAGRATVEQFQRLYEMLFGPIHEDLHINLYELLFSSLVCENFPVADFLFALNFDINSRISGKTLLEALILKSNQGNFDYPLGRKLFGSSIKWLIDKGIDINSYSCIYGNYLHLAILNDNFDAVRLLLDAGAIVDKPDPKFMKPINLALEIEKISLFEAIASHQIKNKIDLDYLSWIFHYIVIFEAEQKFDILQCLVRLKFKPKLLNGRINYLLHYSAYRCNKPLLEMFLRNGADPMEEYPLLDPTSFRKIVELEIMFKEILGHFIHFKDPAIAVAIYRNSFEIVKLFLDFGVDPETTMASGLSLIEYAEQLDRPSIVELLEDYLEDKIFGTVSASAIDNQDLEIKLTCGHWHDLTRIHDLFNQSGKDHVSCDRCFQPVNYDLFFESLLNFDEIPTELSYNQSRSDIEALTARLWPKLTDPDCEIKILRNAVKLRAPIGLMETLKKDSILRVASVNFDFEKFGILYRALIKSNSGQLKENFELMKSSLMSENFNVAEYLIAGRFDVNYKSSEEECLLGFVITAAGIRDPSKLIRWLAGKRANLNIKYGPENRTPIYYAITGNNLDILETLLELKVDTSVIDSLDFTPLAWAVNCGNMGALKVFIDYGFDLHCEYSGSGYNLVQVAIFTGNLDVLKYLTDLGVKPVFNGGETSHVFHRAVLENKYDTIEYLLENGAPPLESCDPVTFEKFVSTDLKLKDRLKQEDPAIVIAILTNNNNIVKLFLDHGVDPNIEIKTSRSLLNLAHDLGLIEIAQLLISHKSIQQSSSLSYIKSCGRPECLETSSPLIRMPCRHYAHVLCLRKSFENSNSDDICRECGAAITAEGFVKSLIFSKKRLPEEIDLSKFKLSIKFLESIYNSLVGSRLGNEYIMSLFERGFPEKYEENGKKRSFLLFLAAKSPLEKFEYFFEARMNSSKPLSQDDIFNVIFSSLCHGNISVSEFIFKRVRFDINYRNGTSSATLLNLVLRVMDKKLPGEPCSPENHERALKWLISKRPNLNLVFGNLGVTSLYLAVDYGLRNDLKLLLGAGADCTKCAKNMHSPVTLSASKGDIEALEIFEDQGIDLCEQFMENGLSLLQVAIFSEKIDACKFLISRAVRPIFKNGVLNYLLHHCVVLKLYKALEFVLKHGADPLEKCSASFYAKMSEDRPDLMAFFDRNDPAIVVAVLLNDLGAVELFLDARVNPNLRISGSSMSILHLACMRDCHEIAHLLISRGADTRSIDSFGKTALSYAKEESIIYLANLSQNYNLDI